MGFGLRNRAWRTTLLGTLAILLVCRSAPAVDSVGSAVSLDQGFSLLYNLEFTPAHELFGSWQRQHPDDPMGPACDAAGYLFSEFNRLGVLAAQFYADDKTFAARKELTPDPAVRDRFYAALDQADKLAHSRLTKFPKDRDALFALTISSGLKADYAGLIEKRNLASLRYTKEATAWSQQLMAVDPGLFRRPPCHGREPIHYWQHGSTGALAGAVRWHHWRQTKGNRRFAIDRRARPLPRTLCPHSAGNCLRPRKRQTTGPPAFGFAA